MGLLLGLLAALTGSTKSVTVCGINSAALARPSEGASIPKVVGYVAGIALGAATLVLVLTSLGRLLLSIMPVPIQVRASLVGCWLGVLGSIQIARGPRVLPHVAWAVPKSWAAWPIVGLPVFGFVRGLAIFNHSPFVSMHATVIAWLLLADAVPTLPLILLFSAGLAMWSVVYLAVSIVRRSSTASVFDSWAPRVLTSGRQIARLEGVCLVMVGVALLAVDVAGPGLV